MFHWLSFFGFKELLSEVVRVLELLDLWRSVAPLLVWHNQQGEAAVHLATKAARLGALAALLSAQPLLVLLPDRRGLMPLHPPAPRGLTGVMEFLYLCGAALDATDGAGMTAAHWAAKNEHHRSWQWLL
eukprot:Selendium_serpulae@DN1141_c0_g1_i1.p2